MESIVRASAIILAAFALALSGCSTCNEGPAFYIQGRLSAHVTNEGLLSADEDDLNVRTHDINGVGYSFQVRANERFVLDLKKPIDLASQSVQISEISNEAGDTVFEVSIVEACRPKIVLSKKCQKVYWYNPYRIPEVITPNHASDSLISDQIIMTPLIGNDKDILGYELRVGDHKECPSVAYRRWKKYKNQIRGARANNEKNARPIARLGEASGEPS